MTLFQLTLTVCISSYSCLSVTGNTNRFIPFLSQALLSARISGLKRKKHKNSKNLVFGSTPNFLTDRYASIAFYRLRFLKIGSFVFLLACAFEAKTQVLYPAYYPEKELLVHFEQAKIPAQQMDAAGILALHYKSKFQDSLSAVYLRLVARIARATNDQKLLAKALWWDAQACACGAYDETEQAITKAQSLLNFASKKNLYPEAITAKLLLADINIYKGLQLSEQNALNAKRFLDEWNIDSIGKDSLKLEVYYRLAHVNLHKKEGEKAAQNLLEQQNYAQQTRNKALQVQAVNNLAQLYWEWPGQEDNAKQWATILHDHYKKEGEKNRLFVVAYILADVHIKMNDTAGAKPYINEAEQLQEDLGIYTSYMYWLALKKRSLGLLTDAAFIKLLDHNFNNRLFLPPALINLHKAAINLDAGQLKTAGFYLAKAKKEGMDSLGSCFTFFDYLPAEFYLLTKNYVHAIQSFSELKRKAEAQGDRDKFLQALMGLSKSYEGKGNYKMANEFSRRYYEIRDSLNRLNSNAKVAFLEVQNERIQVQNERKLNRQVLLKHWLFSIVIIISLISVGVYFLYQYRLRQLQLQNQLAREKTDKIIAETGYQQNLNELTFSALRSQMNPHFIFNAMNTIQGFVYSNDKKSASNYLGKFSQLIRKILDSSNKQTITLGEEIEILQLYTEIEKARYGDNFNITLSIDPALDQEFILIPAMLIQPYVENSIKHGVFHKQGDKTLMISISRAEDGEAIEVIIDDNGIGRERSREINKSRVAHHSFATAANEKRINLINQTINKKTKLKIIDKVNMDGSPAGTTVFITIPVVFAITA